MARREKLSAEALVEIVAHCEGMIKTADDQIAKLIPIVSRTQSKDAHSRMIYWRNYRSAMRQSMSIARQRAGMPADVT